MNKTGRQLNFDRRHRPFFYTARHLSLQIQPSTNGVALHDKQIISTIVDLNNETQSSLRHNSLLSK